MKTEWIKNFNHFFKGPRSLAVLLSGDHLHLVFYDRTGIFGNESFFLRESDDEMLAMKVRECVARHKPNATLLMIARSELIQKEISFERPAVSREDLEQVLSRALPYSPKEMAYGLSWANREAPTQGGLLYAIPEKKITEILDYLERIGIKPDEIYAEDQVLYEAVKECADQQNILLLDRNPDRIIAILGSKERLLQSRVIEPPQNGTHSLLPEFSLLLVESGRTPERIYLTGTWQEEDREAIESHLRTQTECLPSFMGNGEFPAPLAALACLRKEFCVSLLPAKLKISRWKLKQEIHVREIGILLLAVFFCSVFLLCSYYAGLNQAKKKLEEKTHRFEMDMKNLQEIQASLDKVKKAELSELRILGFLRTLAQTTPSALKIKEVHAEPGGWSLSGDCPTHATLTTAVQGIERAVEVANVKIEHTRLRKRMGEDYLEFEVSGQWKNI